MENYLKQEFATIFPEGRFSFSQRGFVVFKTDRPAEFSDLAKLVSARTFGESLFDVRLKVADASLEGVRWSAKSLQTALDDSQVSGLELLGPATISAIVNPLKEYTANHPNAIPIFEHLHVWLRDGLEPAGEFARSAAITKRHPVVTQFQHELSLQLKKVGLLQADAIVDGNAAPGSLVLDICLLNPFHFWVGQHAVQLAQQRWSGGVLPVVPSDQSPISRAYYKIRESVIWSGVSCDHKTKVAEIGASPGGSCQWLLEQGASVIGIDPADIDERVAAHSKFTHIRKRGREVRRKEISGIHWLLSDANISPDQILDTFEELLKHPSVQPKVLIVTIKLPDVKTLEKLELWKKRVAGWGFRDIKCRQLVFNRQEITLVAIRE